ncbi:MAG: DedA family protein [Thiobacillaceae bacterium]
MLHEFVTWILATVHNWGYAGIFIAMTLESTVLPVPSEIVLIPAGYLAYEGKMNLFAIILSSTLGGLVGSTINYSFALWVGRPFLEHWGKYFFVRPHLLHKTDAFFVKHGAISIFSGRLIFGIRHLISLPAGVARMPWRKFAFYTCLGAGLWSTVLASLGYFLGDNEDLVRQYQAHIAAAVLVFVALIIGGYWWWQRKNGD